MDKKCCMFVNTTVHEFHLNERFNILELNDIAQSKQKEIVYLHIKKSWSRQSAYIKAPVVIKQVAKLKENPTKKDFIVEFYNLDMNDMFSETGNLKLGPISRQKIDEDGRFSYWDKSAIVTGYFSEE